MRKSKILAVKLADLGDALLITPALAALREAYPDAQIDVLTTNGRPVLQNNPAIDNIILFDKYLFDEPRTALQPRNLLKAVRFLAKLTFNRYDTVIFFHHFTMRWGVIKFAALALATLARRRVGLDNGRAWFLNCTIPDRGFGTLSEREYWLEVVAAIGAAKPLDQTPRLYLSETATATGQKLANELKAADAPLVAIAPGSGTYSLARRWLPVNFARVADALVKKYDANVAIVGGQDELELCQQVQSFMEGSAAATVLAGQTSVAEISAFLKECALFVGNDGGLMQLAGAVGTPLVAVFGPTNHRAWSPLGWQTPEQYKNSRYGKTIVVQADLDLKCRPCLYTGLELGQRYGCAPRPCLTELTAEQVIEAADMLLALRYQPSAIS